MNAYREQAADNTEPAKRPVDQSIQLPMAFYIRGHMVACTFGAWRYRGIRFGGETYTDCRVFGRVEWHNARADVLSLLRKCLDAGTDVLVNVADNDENWWWRIVSLRIDDDPPKPTILVKLYGSNKPRPEAP